MNCRFIFTCNFINKIIEPLHSRCTVVDFRSNLSRQPLWSFFTRLKTILTHDRSSYEDKVLAKLTKRYCQLAHLPDARTYAATGAVTSLFSLMSLMLILTSLLASLKKKEFTTVKNWVVQHMDNDPRMVMRKIYDSLHNVLKPASIPEAVLIIAKYMRDISVVPYQHSYLACLTEA